MQKIGHRIRLFTKKQRPTVDIRDITDLYSLLGQEALKIYERSFPDAERDPVENIAASLHNPDPEKEVTRFRVLIEQGMVAGFIYFSSYKEYYLGFLKFIAVVKIFAVKGLVPFCYKMESNKSAQMGCAQQVGLILDWYWKLNALKWQKTIRTGEYVNAGFNSTGAMAR